MRSTPKRANLPPPRRDLLLGASHLTPPPGSAKTPLPRRRPKRRDNFGARVAELVDAQD
ncbi:MAG: hypothetical protein ABGY32_14580 [bacterium]